MLRTGPSEKFNPLSHIDLCNFSRWWGGEIYAFQLKLENGISKFQVHFLTGRPTNPDATFQDGGSAHKQKQL